MPPSVAIKSNAAGTTASAAVTFTFTWSEDVGTSFTSDDVAVSGGTAGAWTQLDATRYTLQLTPPGGGLGSTTVSVPAGRVTDLAANASTTAVSLAQPYDTRAVGWTLVWSDEFDTDGLPDACGAFHNYQLTWSADRVEIGVNGSVYMVFDNPRNGETTRWPFDNPQYLIINLAIGGDLGGAVDPAFTTHQMEVEHVRVYRR